MCAFLQSSQTFLDIAGAVLLACALGIVAYDVYLLALGWGDSETHRHVQKLGLRAVGFVALALFLNAAPGIFCS